MFQQATPHRLFWLACCPDVAAADIDVDENKARFKRILAAGRALANVIRIDQKTTINTGNMLPIPQLGMIGEEDDDEVIVFQPSVNEKRIEVVEPNRPPSEISKLVQSSSSVGDLKFYSSAMFAPLDNHCHHDSFDATPQLPLSVGSILPQQLQPVQMQASRWSLKDATSLSNPKLMLQYHLELLLMFCILRLPHLHKLGCSRIRLMVLFGILAPHHG
ncbi:hypothetical protein F3Y22_tig00110885pilonHSYRG00034 [Hibiscus syriacus]|uniref:Uncharacterized protein n=1 Tax=Hibiscus syriacus TaxID=106335 RepID=A0A6A2ZKI2_HIBSY|nr:hypothetical protein F3Y22_tig00110885pilonHSYRG00034 [Hibiscus syriacus]